VRWYTDEGRERRRQGVRKKGREGGRLGEREGKSGRTEG